MSKYICLCGSTYKTKEMADLHAKMYEDLALAEGFPRHKIFKQHWQARFATWFFNYNWVRFVRFVGAYMMYLVALHHFKISLEWWEAGLMGIGMWLYINE